MALTGVALFLFVVGHLAGNLQIFGAPDQINGYAHFLKSTPELLWGARLGLLACVALHIAAAVTLTVENRAARPEGYAGSTAYGSTRGSRTMILSGSVILAFILYHLAHFTALLPGINGVGDFSKLTVLRHGERVADVYGMIVLSFQVWWVVLFYLVAQGLLFMHLGHGLAAMFQSLGLRDHVWAPRIAQFAKVASIAIFVGYASIPVSIYLRMVGAGYATSVRNQLTHRPPGLEAPAAPATGSATPTPAATPQLAVRPVAAGKEIQ